MKNEIIANSCRICLTQTKKLRSLYKPVDEGDEPPNEMLQLITGIQVEKVNNVIFGKIILILLFFFFKLEDHEMLPKNICKNCELSLSMAYEFRENALKTQKMIIDYLKELYKNQINEEEDENDEECNRSPQSSNYKREYEDIMNLEPLDCVDALEDDMQVLNNGVNKSCLENDEMLNDTHDSVCENEGMDTEDQVFYKQQEHLEILKEETENFDENENFSDDQHNDSVEENNEDLHNQSIFNDQEEVDKQNEIKNEIEIMPADNDDCVYNQSDVSESNSCRKLNRKTISKIFIKPTKTLGKLTETNNINNMKLIPRRGRKSTNDGKNATHICDICGNVFAKLGRMMEHRQRHNKELKYSCE